MFNSFHRFPDTAEHLKKWIYLIGLYNNQKIEWNASLKICALHFPRDSFTADDQLKYDAKPSIFKHAISCRQKEM